MQCEKQAGSAGDDRAGVCYPLSAGEGWVLQCDGQVASAGDGRAGVCYHPGGGPSNLPPQQPLLLLHPVSHTQPILSLSLSLSLSIPLPHTSCTHALVLQEEGGWTVMRSRVQL